VTGVPDLLTRLLSCLVLAPLALLCACGGDSGSKTEGRAASGEVLEGSVSDAMLPLDQLKSQAPRVQEATPSGDASGAAGDAEQKPGAADGEGGGDAGEDADAAAPAAEPAEGSADE
jgi:hypothetical protein